MWISRKTLADLTLKLHSTSEQITKLDKLINQLHSIGGTPKVLIKNLSTNPLPTYGTSGAAGMDVRAFLKDPIILDPGKRKLITTGLYMKLPDGYECQIRSRSGMALKSGVVIAHGVGTLDSDYLGELGVILHNISDKPFMIENGDRIAQIVIARYAQVSWEQVSSLPETERGDAGFGSTGTK